MNFKKAILSVSLIMYNTKSLITEIRKLINVYKNEVELEEKFVYYFINLYYFLLFFTISFLFKSNLITFIIVNSLLYQLWFRYKFIKVLSKFTDSFFRIYKCFH